MCPSSRARRHHGDQVYHTVQLHTAHTGAGCAMATRAKVRVRVRVRVRIRGRVRVRVRIRGRVRVRVRGRVRVRVRCCVMAAREMAQLRTNSLIFTHLVAKSTIDDVFRKDRAQDRRHAAQAGCNFGFEDEEENLTLTLAPDMLHPTGRTPERTFP